MYEISDMDDAPMGGGRPDIKGRDYKEGRGVQ